MEVNASAEVIVRTPMRMPKRDISKFVEDHRDWIEKHKHVSKGKYNARRIFQTILNIDINYFYRM